jgi:hypothetical protein
MAGAGKKTFTAGEVLTASDVNTYLMEQSVMVFGGTAARSSAIPTPSEGMTTYRTDSQQIESYDGAEWRGMSGLQLVKKQTIGTGVASVQVTDAFSATYDNYKILISGGVASGGSFGKFILGATTSGYYVGAPGSNYSGSGTTFVATNNAAAANYTWYLQTTWLDLSIEMKNPFLAQRTGFNFSFNSNAAGFSGSGVQESNTSFTDFTISSFGAQTLTGGTIYVYGYGT